MLACASCMVAPLARATLRAPRPAEARATGAPCWGVWCPGRQWRPRGGGALVLYIWRVRRTVTSTVVPWSTMDRWINGWICRIEGQSANRSAADRRRQTRAAARASPTVGGDRDVALGLRKHGATGSSSRPPPPAAAAVAAAVAPPSPLPPRPAACAAEALAAAAGAGANRGGGHGGRGARLADGL